MNETERLVVYNDRYPMIAALIVHEKLQWDDILKRNVWAHPQMISPAWVTSEACGEIS